MRLIEFKRNSGAIACALVSLLGDISGFVQLWLITLESCATEITRKQKDAEIRKVSDTGVCMTSDTRVLELMHCHLILQMSANAITRQTEQIAETDLVTELQATKAQLRRLGKAQTETEERVRHNRLLSTSQKPNRLALVTCRSRNGDESLRS